MTEDNGHRVRYVDTEEELEMEEEPEVEGFHDVYVKKNQAWQQCNDKNCTHTKDHSALRMPGGNIGLGFSSGASGGARGAGIA